MALPSSVYPSVQNIPELQPKTPGPQGGGQQLAGNPILQAMKVIGSGILAQKEKGNPNAQQQADAFGKLLQSMSSQGATPQTQGPQQPAPAVPAPAPQAMPQQPVAATMPQQAPARALPKTQVPVGQGQKPYAQFPGTRPISKQPVIM